MISIIKHRFLVWALWLLLFSLLLGLIIYILRLPQLPPDISQLSLKTGTSFYSDQGELISSLTDRHTVPISQISPYFLKAIVAVEDAQFYQHHGISKRGLLRALLKDLRHLRVVEGGSSITQQLAKNLFLTFEQTFGRKFEEMFLAMQLEQQFSKAEILQAYCNQICFGPGIYGIELAAQSYLGKHASELNLAEAAFLANIPRSPVAYDPYKNMELTQKRQMIVFKRMQAAGFITEEEVHQAAAQPLRLQRLNLNWGQANYFMSYAQSLVANKFGRDVVNYGGLKIYTTLDNRLQAFANRAVEKGLAELDQAMGLREYRQASSREQADYSQAALVAIEPKTGKIKALVGGRDFRASEFNRAIQNNRLPGSSFKPIIYLTALERGDYNLATVIEDRPITFGSGKASWSPNNYENEYRGPVLFKYALMHSINVVAAKITAEVGPENVIQTARQMGITAPLQPDLSLALGTYGVSPLEMATAYCGLANDGIYFTPQIVKYVESNDGRPLEETTPKSHRVFNPQIIYLMLDMLQGVFESGTAQSARQLSFDRPAAGKTGTTNDYRDAWFIGFTPQLVTAVWVGFDDNRIMRAADHRGITGARGALPIWVYFMKAALADQRYQDFPIPPGIIFENVDPTTGQIAATDDPTSMRVALKFGTQLESKAQEPSE
ncbi:PBP1A family penicillin-binding protein [candidate division KSB1 bacterium]|nr:PBP1A family penicillin-binding protein [candidate division KSB1 bacterium]